MLHTPEQLPLQHLKNALLVLEMLARACTLGAFVPDLKHRIEELAALLRKHNEDQEPRASWFEDLDSRTVALLEQELIDMRRCLQRQLRRLEQAAARQSDPERAASVLDVLDDIRRSIDEQASRHRLSAA
jgi:Mg2+ and Co2+ transporter CorA